ncbi:MAG TPA: hypothetical protein VK002_00620 [Rubricoccaceae bacterium]|nr:hypothetical protein [Rubricoccaceae bacterium]
MRCLLAFVLATLSSYPAAGQGSYEGELESRDETLTSGEFSDAYTVALRQGQWVEVVMRSGDFNPYLILRPPSCSGKGGACEGQTDDDDFFPDGTAFIWVEADQGGTWEVLATSFAPGDKGNYTLDIIVHPDGGGPRTPGAALDAPRTERGTLAAGDGTLRSGEYTDRYGFVGRAGERVVVDLRSTAFDPYLILQMPGGTQQLDNDDWEGSTAHARIEHTLPADGVYRVLVTSYAVGETGAYELQITSAGTAPPSDDPFTK